MDREEQDVIPATQVYRVRIPAIVYWTVRELFAAAIVTYLVFYLIDSLAGSFISMQFNMDIVLWIAIVCGVASVLVGPRGSDATTPHERTRVTFGTITLIVALGIVSALIVFIKTRSLGRIGYAISLMSGLIVMLLSFIMLFDDETVSPKEH